MRTILWTLAAAVLLAASASAQESKADESGGQAAPAAEPRPKTHTVVKGDCLWALARTYYGNPYRWKVIYAANRDKIKDPHWIYPGQVFSLEEVPDPAIGEVGARPVETGAAVTIPVETGPSEPQAEAPTAAPSVATAEQYRPQPLPDDTGDDLREKMPAGMTGVYPSFKRAVMAKDWQEDGKIVQLDEHKMVASAGDGVTAKLGKRITASAGDQFEVYRRDSPQETDADKDATYLQRIGIVEVRQGLGGRRYHLYVVSSNDTVQPGDLLKRQAR